MGYQTPVAEYGSTGPPSCVDCPALVSPTSSPMALTDRQARCVGSCTAHLEELTDPADLIQGVGTEVTHRKDRTVNFAVDSNYKQFRFSVGAPEAETKFKQAVQSAQQTNRNAVQYPSLYVCLVGVLCATFELTSCRLFTDLLSKIGTQ